MGQFFFQIFLSQTALGIFELHKVTFSGAYRQASVVEWSEWLSEERKVVGSSPRPTNVFTSLKAFNGYWFKWGLLQNIYLLSQATPYGVMVTMTDQ